MVCPPEPAWRVAASPVSGSNVFCSHSPLPKVSLTALPRASSRFRKMRGGFWTPATIVVDRLIERAGMTIEVEGD